MEVGSDKLLLAGYVALTEHGFALPCFASSPKSNAWHTAISLIEGDHCASVRGFELFESDEIRALPQESHCSVSIGDPWLDVFLWGGAAYVGTPEEIWKAIQITIDEISRKAPLTLLDLALFSNRDFVGDHVCDATNFLRNHYGHAKAAAWRRDMLVRHQVLIRLRRVVAESQIPEVAARTWSAVELVDCSDDALEIRLPNELRQTLDQAGQQGRVTREIEGLARLLNISIAESRSESRGVKQQSLVLGYDADQADPPHDSLSNDAPLARDARIAVIVSGRRARAIARYAMAPEWTPVWLDGGYQVRSLDEKREKGGRYGWRTIDITENLSELTPISAYDVIVYLADDDEIEGPVADRLNEAQGLTLFAPALPVDEPSKHLVNYTDNGFGIHGFDIIIDTSIARSPFWSGSPRRAFDRRIADVVIEAAVLCAGASPVAHQIAKRRHRFDEPVPLLTLALLRPNYGLEARDAFRPALALASESTWAFARSLRSRAGSLATVDFDIRMLDRGLHDTVPGIGEIRDRQPHFEDFAHAVLQDINPERASPSLLNKPSRTVPPDVLRELRFPDLRFGFSLRPLKRGGVLVVSEAPSLKALRRAEKRGWLIVRYTDRETLRDLLLPGKYAEQLPLPSDILLPKVRRLQQNRGLVARGIDPRDVVRFDQKRFEAWRIEAKQLHLLNKFRRYRTSLKSDGRSQSLEYVVPWPDLKAARKDDPAAGRLLGRQAGIMRSPDAPKRPSDLRAAWSEPLGGARRFIVKDGVIPISIEEIDKDEVPAQRFFILDGDASVPALLGSRAFSVWARSTLSRSTSWMSRFSVSGTFETFPIPDCFEIRRPNGGPPQLWAGDTNKRLRGLLEEFELEYLNLGWWQKDVGKLRSPYRKLDNIILAAFDLSGDATDLDILERLVQSNLAASG